MFDSGVFNYIDVLDKAADASWLRNEVISNNIANVNTPEYKRQDVSFEAELQQALRANKYESLDDKIDSVNLKRLDARVYTDSADFSYRLDGNNVDIDNENVELASNQIKYNALIQSINGKFSELKSVMK
ncbi:MAG: flagellar basal body rod protein FlgB [Clostridia bacterium]|nr:flagellar basal body rod protein FlgB [Clostridia bacterium]